MGAESTFVKNFLQGAATLADGTGTPVTLALALETGSISWGPVAEHLNEDVLVEARGRFKSLNRGKRIYPSVQLVAHVGNWVGGSTSAPGTLLEFITKKGAYAANVSTLGANRRYTCDLRLAIEGTDWGDGSDETLTFEDVVWQANGSEGEETNQITLTGKVLGGIQSVNSTNTVRWTEV